jgi:hypothetical protein
MTPKLRKQILEKPSMSAIGTKLTSRSDRAKSALGGMRTTNAQGELFGF